GARGQRDAVEPIARLLQRRRLRHTITARADKPAERVKARPAQGGVLRDDEILEHAHAGEEADVLESSGNAGIAGDAPARHALEPHDLAGTVEPQAAGTRPVK